MIPIIPFLLFLLIPPLFSNQTSLTDEDNGQPLEIANGAQNILLEIEHHPDEKSAKDQGLLICFPSIPLNNNGNAKASRRFQLLDQGYDQFGRCQKLSNGPHIGILLNYQWNDLNIETSFGFHFACSIERKKIFGIQLREAHKLLSSMKGCEKKFACEMLNGFGESFKQSMKSESGEVAPYVDDFGPIWYLGINTLKVNSTSRNSKITYFGNCSSWSIKNVTSLNCSEQSIKNITTMTTKPTKKITTTTPPEATTIMETTTIAITKTSTKQTQGFTSNTTSTSAPKIIATTTSTLSTSAPTTNAQTIETSTDWPRSDQLTEEQKEKKLKECKRQIDEYNQVLGHDKRTLNEIHCLMNNEERNNKSRRGGVPKVPYKPFEGNQTQRCNGPKCQVIVPIPEEKLNITWRRNNTEQTIIRPKNSTKQRSRRDSELVEETVYCREEEFDLRIDVESEICRKKIGQIERQGPCNSCAFVATVTAIYGRYCMARGIYHSKNWGPIDVCEFPLMIEKWYGLRCPTNAGFNCKYFIQEGCQKMQQENHKLSIRDPIECLAGSCQDSEWPEPIWEYHTKTQWINDACKPYRKFADYGCCKHPLIPAKCCLGEFCRMFFQTCDNWNSENMNLSGNLSSIYHLSGSEYIGIIMDEIMKNGPVTAVMDAYDEFDWSYKEGKAIYTVSKHAKDPVGHVVRLIGFGEKFCYSNKKQSGEPLFTIKYWIAANSWGQHWNGDGTFRIRRGTNECGIESNFDYGHIELWDWQWEEP